jgi:hypothetical protein
MSIKLSEVHFNEALENLSWTKLAKHLAQTAWTQEDVNKLLRLLKRSEPLVLKRKSPTQEQKRNQLLDELAKALVAKGYAREAEEVREHDKRLKDIDGVYQGILNLLKRTAAATMRPELRVAALLDRANREYIKLQEKMLKAILKNAELDLDVATLTDDNGHEYSPEGVHEMLLETFASTLGMEAHINKWYDANGLLVLPSLPSASKKNRYAAGSVQLLAAAWKHWQFAERRQRYLGAVLAEHTTLPEAWEQTPFKSFWESSPARDNLEFYDYLANSRLAERLKQNWATVLVNKNCRALVSDINGSVELLPKGFVSLGEIHSATALSRLLSGEIFDDPKEYAGLTFTEWVRGYSALQAISQAALDAGDPKGLTIRFAKPDLAAILARLGLRNGKADVFIGHAIYRKASRDMFDQPLIQMEDGSVLLLALASGTSSIPNVILSTLGMLKVSLDSRGKRFEKKMIEFLGRQGIKAKNIQCNRGGETFDYDVAFVWGDYLFLLECKSRSLSGGDPSRAYFFSLGIREVVEQVKRLADGLKRYPDIIPSYFPEAAGKEVVHCVINSLPYTMYGGIDGIRFTDEGSFTRFFQQSEIGKRSLGLDSGIGDIDANTAIAFLWDGAKPTPEDLLRQLDTPIQLVMATAHSQLSPVDVPVDEHTLLRLIQYHRTNSTQDSYRLAAREAGYRTGKASAEYGEPEA